MGDEENDTLEEASIGFGGRGANERPSKFAGRVKKSGSDDAVSRFTDRTSDHWSKVINISYAIVPQSTDNPPDGP